MLYKKTETTKELEQIITLQQKNLSNSLSDDEKSKEGFVSAVHSLAILKEMNDVVPHIIAVDNHNVVGYALCMHPIFAKSIALLKPMFDEIEKVFSKKDTYISMGQICIDKDYRGQGIFRQLYNTMKTFVQPEFEYIITGVNSKNTRSLGAHHAIGFENLSTIYYDGESWEIIVLK